jgi:uncharacterized protein (TIGR03067 family)
MRLCVPLLAGLSLAFAPAPPPRPDTTKTELKKLQGEWARVRVVIAGREAPTGGSPALIVIKDDRLEYQTGGKPTVWALTVDARKKPKVFDIRGLSDGVTSFVYWGIYRLEGDTLTVCSRMGGPETGRPTDFDASRPKFYLEIFKRRKP